MRRVLVLAVLACVFASAVQAQVCKSRNLRGSYAVITEGHLAMAPGTPMVPFRSLSVRTFDYVGNQSTQGTLTTPHAAYPITASGWHVMDPDCSYKETFTWQVGDAEPQPDLKETCVVLDGGEQIRCRGMSQTSVYASVLRRMKSTGRCKTWALRGTFEPDCSGWVATGAPENPYVPLEGLGVATFDRRGNMSGWGNMNFGGMPMVITYEGDLEVDDDCTLTIEETDYNETTGVTASSSAIGLYVDKNTLHSMYLGQGQIFACTLHRISPRRRGH